ncbi:MAG: hypothetical protein EZS28_054217, partial [Streblomastix strix]
STNPKQRLQSQYKLIAPIKWKKIIVALHQLEYRKSLRKGKEAKIQKLKAYVPLMNQARAAMPKLKLKQLPQFQDLRVRPKEAGKKLSKLNLNQKPLMKRMQGNGVLDRAGILKPREISVEISLWNREEERADEDGSSGDGGKD